MVSQGEESAIFTSIVHGHIVYRAVWTPLIGEHLTVRRATKPLEHLVNIFSHSQSRTSQLLASLC